MLDKAIDMSDHKPALRIIFQRDVGRAALDPSRGDLDWEGEMQRIRHAGRQFKDYVPVDSQHPLYILYTSGTTGLPKVRSMTYSCCYYLLHPGSFLLPRHVFALLIYRMNPLISLSS